MAAPMKVHSDSLAGFSIGLLPADDLNKMLEDCKILKTQLADQNERDNISEEKFLQVLSNLECTPSLPVNAEVLDVVTETFRCLRNSCVMCRRNQDMLAGYDVFPTAVCSLKVLLNNHKSLCSFSGTNSENSETDKILIACHCCIQFFGNLVTSHEDNGRAAWQAIKSCLKDIFAVKDNKLTNYTCMFIKNSMTCYTEGCQRLLEELPELVTDILDALSQHTVEWGLFVIQDLLLHKEFLKVLWDHLDLDKRILLLDIILDSVHESEKTNECKVSLGNLRTVEKSFIELSNDVLHATSEEQVTNMKPMVFVKTLDILCTATGLHDFYCGLQENEKVVIAGVNLLQSIHMIGKSGDNMFTSLSKIQSTETVDQSHPSYAMKRQLIRLIGNLCYRQRANQDMVRQLNGIPLLLDHTNIDKRNPYISQWSIFAIHNLCENNLENQSALSQLKLKGVTDNADVLRDCGISAEVIDGKVVVNPASKPS